MTHQEIQESVRDFIALVERPGAIENPDEHLALLLDLLALGSHFADYPYEDCDLETDERGRAEVYAEVFAAFPDYGLFDVAFPFSEAPGDTSLVTADAIDSIADIYLALKRVEAIWAAFGVESALAEYRFSYDSHWHWHLRELQLYLHARKATPR